MKSGIAVVRGRVQGVGFRYSALNKARALGLRGWVRNEMDGSVSARFEGDENSFDSYLEWLRTGPPSASVSSVDFRELNPDSDLGQFQVAFQA
ncbi:MAG: acylphosphatase [Spirochaetales bacterium]|nr:acylphosphatase [Spirochaetales bacterium]